MAAFGAGLVITVHGTLRYGLRLTAADLIGDVLMAAGSFLYHVWTMGGVFVAAAVVVAWKLWRHRKDRDRVPRAYGAKSRALLATLARRAREASKPRPAFRPVPGGAR
jgi:hypothetical protein